MLNELSQVVDSLERLGTVAPARHPRINPMGKNKDLLVVCVDNDGNPLRLEVLSGDIAARLFRIEHGSAGSSFPGFNLPTPLRSLEDAPVHELVPAIEKVISLGKNKNSSAAEIADAVRNLFNLSKPKTYSASQGKQYQRSCSELVDELYEAFTQDLAGLKNFKALIDAVRKSKPTLPLFAESLSGLLVRRSSDFDRHTGLLYQEILFGIFDWKKRSTEIGTPDYWKEKANQDKAANQPIYLDMAMPVEGCWRVAHSEMSELLNQALFTIQAKDNGNEECHLISVEDAFGDNTGLQDKFPNGPKVAELGNVKLFSVNTSEVQALQRYRFKGSQSFPVSSARVQKMSDALLYLASEDKRGITCRAIPSAQPDKRDLLVVYLEGEPEGRASLAEMFGGEVNTFSDADFEAIAQPVLEMLDGKSAANPNLNLRLLSLCPIDKAKKQVSLNRCLRVKDVIRAAKDWEAGARNTPEVSVWFYDKKIKQSVFKSHTAPCPLDLAIVVNRVWSADKKSGFNSSYQRAISVADAYDVFLSDAPQIEQKVKTTLGLLVNRMHPVLATLGAIKATREWTVLSDVVRWQSVKAIALLGILLQHLSHQYSIYMKEPIYQLGRLLALADSLHFHYCKFVRTSDEKRKAGKVDAPGELLGNSLFNYALDQPVCALARLAERIRPYKGWADTYSGDEANLVHWFIRLMSDTVQYLDNSPLPSPMTDADKAKLLLGYLADHSKNETTKQ